MHLRLFGSNQLWCTKIMHLHLITRCSIDDCYCNSKSFVCVCRNISSEIYGIYVIFSVKLTLSMQIVGFAVRLLSSSLWVQMYRLGVSYIDSSAPREADFDLRNSFLSPATPAVVRSSGCDDALGGSIYDPTYYSSLFEDGRDNSHLYAVWFPFYHL